MSRIQLLLDDRQDIGDDYDYQFQTWKMEQEKRILTPNEYEIRISEENKVTEWKELKS